MRRWDTMAYRRLRAYWQLRVRAGNVHCVRCGGLIDPREKPDLGHVDGDPFTIAGPEHRRCNRATAGRRRRVTSRVW